MSENFLRFDKLSPENISLTYFKIEEPIQKEIEVLMQDLKNFHDRVTKVSNTTEQGKLLEKIVEKIFSGIKVLDYIPNKKTSGNEMDMLIKLNTNGRMFRGEYFGYVLPKWFPDYAIIECKNYRDTDIGITYINKFHSLLESHSCHLGIFVYYDHLTGKNLGGWQASKGLISKLAFKHSILAQRNIDSLIIIDVSYESLCLLKDKDYDFFEWINELKIKLVNDVKSSFISSENHENEFCFLDEINN